MKIVGKTKRPALYFVYTKTIISDLATIKSLKLRYAEEDTIKIKNQ